MLDGIKLKCQKYLVTVMHEIIDCHISKTHTAEQFHLEDKRQCSPCSNSYFDHNTEIVHFNGALSWEKVHKQKTGS